MLQFICPASVIEEVRRNKWNICIARFTNWLSIIESLQYCKLSGALLKNASDAIEILSTLCCRHLAPDLGVRVAGCQYSKIYIFGICIGNLCQYFSGSWINSWKVLTGFRRDEFSIDEEFVTIGNIYNRGRLQCWCIFKGAHLSTLSPGSHMKGWHSSHPSSSFFGATNH